MTNELRALIDTKLDTLKQPLGIKDIGYRLASDQKLFPHVVWYITGISPMDMGRFDYALEFHVWGREEATVFQIMDEIIKLLAFSNDPTNEIYPTFYDSSSGTVDDPDKTLVHGVVRMRCQVYEVGVTDRGILREE